MLMLMGHDGCPTLIAVRNRLGYQTSNLLLQVLVKKKVHVNVCTKQKKNSAKMVNRLNLSVYSLV